MTKALAFALILSLCLIVLLVNHIGYQDALLQRKPQTVVKIVERRVFASLEDIPHMDASMLPPLPASKGIK